MKYILTFLTLFFLIFDQQDIYAAKKTKKKSSIHIPIASSLVVDASTGRILHSEGAYKQIFPASLTKVMTAYLTFAALEDGKIKLTDYATVSKEAASMLPSRIGLKAGSKVTIKDALTAVIVKSANDMAVVLAEAIEGDHKKFVEKMNFCAKKLGMSNTNFTNASGWHHPDQKSTAIDMAKLAIAIKRDFPQYYHLHSITKFKINGTLYKGHNRITEFYPGADGLKTGFHCPAGFNIISTATKNGKSLIAVVTGGHSAIARDRKIIHLLDKHFGEKSKMNYVQLAVKQVAVKNKFQSKKKENSSSKKKRR
jgi:D-alanyl-D-alanine carboxypeptidase (penicillin-binding protein 5/6)